MSAKVQDLIAKYGWEGLYLKASSERDALREALQALYDASPTSCEDKALIDAQKLAEKVLGIK